MKKGSNKSYLPYYVFIALASFADLIGVVISIVQTQILALISSGVGTILFVGTVILERISDIVLGTGNPFTGIVATIFVSQFIVSMFMLTFALGIFVVQNKDRVGATFFVSLILVFVMESVPFLSAGPVWTWFGARKLVKRIVLDKAGASGSKNDV